MQALINSLTEQQLNTVLSMVDLDCVDWTPTIEQLVDAIQMFGYSEQDIMDTLNSINAFVFEDEIPDVQSDLIEYEINMFFESVSTELFWREIAIVEREYAELELHNDLFIHSIDPQVGF